MFSSSPLDKICVGPDNCSSGRHNSPNRFPVGITSLGDENQQNRIQLAVHKYNSSASNVLNSRCVIAPVRHNYLKTSPRAKNYEGDTEGVLKNEKKSRNQYEGVGAFPTVHLKKSAVRYRPIKKFNDVKIPYPELPVNRFLSHLPEVCSDLKSSTRSVLDVLEDLSGKKIHSKQDSASNKPKSKGLGGDHLLNPNAVYKPLFVQKPKLNSVLTRDNTTQTLCPLGVETTGPPIINSHNKADDSDPRAELRRKLARQNNEIFASLSSSISSAFALKRKIDKVLPARDDKQFTDGSATKKSKISDHELNNYSENGVLNTSRSKTNLNDSVKSIRKTKFNETSTPTSPNKDRLTTIFLDMQNTSPKSQIFQKKPSSTEKLTESDTQTNLSNGFTSTTDNSEGRNSSPIVNSSTGTPAAENGKSESGIPSSAEKTDSKKSESEQPSKTMFNFPLSKAETTQNDVTKFTSPTFQFGVNTSSSSNFVNTSVVDSHSPKDSPSDTKNESKQEKKKDNQVVTTLFTFGKPNDKPAFASFKFGTNENVSLPSSIAAPKDPKVIATAATTTSLQTIVPPVITTTSAAAQFSFVSTTTTGITTTTQQPNGISTIQNSAVQFGATTNTTTTTTTTQDLLSIPPKPVFTFGHSAPPSQENFAANKTPEKKPVANGLQNPIATTTHSAVTFTFGQKSSLDSLAKPGQNMENQTVTTVSFSQSATGSAVATQSTKSLFTFGQKSETPANPAPVPTGEGQKMTFSFGQKANAEQNKPTEGSAPKPATLFSFGQKSPPQESIKSTAAASADQPPSSQPTSVFGSVSQPVTTSQVQFGKTTPQATNGLGPKSETGFLGSNSAPAFSQSSTAFPLKTALFGSSMTGFGSPSTQASNGFGTSTTTASGLSFGSPVVTSASGFDTSSSQSRLTFGVSSAPQSSGFGSSTPAFGVSTSTQSFGASSATQSTQSTSTFGVSTTTQSTPVFGTSSQSTGGFGACAFPVQSTTGFGSPAVTSSSGFGVSQPSFSQPLGNKPTTSLGQPSSVFGQNPGPSFPSSTTFGSDQSNVFGQKANREGDVFDQNKLQAPSFNTQNKFSFGMSTSNATGFTTSPPKTTAAPVFSFGGNTTGNTFSFGSNSSVNNNMQVPFAFKSPTNEPFKFGATSTKEEPSTGFATTTPATFSFGGQMNNNAMGEQKPSFNFGSTQVSSSAPFTFGSTPSPSLFSFGSSSSASSGSSFNFGTPNPANPFGQTPTASPGTPFVVPGTFSIGSGTSQSRPRATSRPRRRP